jgi:hypothetical protein
MHKMRKCQTIGVSTDTVAPLRKELAYGLVRHGRVRKCHGGKLKWSGGINEREREREGGGSMGRDGMEKRVREEEKERPNE